MKLKLAGILFCFILYTALTAQQQPNFKEGKKVYEQYCLSCHQADGEGVPPRLIPPLAQASYVTGNKTQLIQWVLQGTPQEKQLINGTYYSDNMPPQDFLTNQQIAAVLTYIRNSFGNKASAVFPSEVEKVRATLKK
jgi:mono/diheme cytochrome c family protein